MAAGDPISAWLDGDPAGLQQLLVEGFGALELHDVLDIDHENVLRIIFSLLMRRVGAEGIEIKTEHWVWGKRCDIWVERSGPNAAIGIIELKRVPPFWIHTKESCGERERAPPPYRYWGGRTCADCNPYKCALSDATYERWHQWFAGKALDDLVLVDYENRDNDGQPGRQRVATVVTEAQKQIVDKYLPAAIARGCPVKTLVCVAVVDRLAFEAREFTADGVLAAGLQSVTLQ